MELKRFGWLDTIICILLTGGVIYSFPELSKMQPSIVTIYRDLQILAEYPITENQTFTIHGYEGEMTIAIKNNSVSVKESSCKHQLCVRSGGISHANGQIICAPNHIVIFVHTNNKSSTGVDAIAQ